MKSYVSKSLSLNTNITPVNLLLQLAKPVPFQFVVFSLSLVSPLPMISLLPLHVTGFSLCALLESASL